jgi:hypothetical protein
MNKKLDVSEIYLQEDEYLQVDISGLPCCENIQMISEHFVLIGLHLALWKNPR